MGNDSFNMDIGVSWNKNKLMWVGILADSLSKLDMAVLYNLNKKTTIAFSCSTIINSDKLPIFELGLKYKPEKKTRLRVKISDQGELSGSFKVVISNAAIYTGFLSVIIERMV